jgi:hypothetical protein
VAAFVSALLASKPHPEQGYRACLGLMRLGKRYSAARLDLPAHRSRWRQWGTGTGWSTKSRRPAWSRAWAEPLATHRDTADALDSPPPKYAASGTYHGLGWCW